MSTKIYLARDGKSLGPFTEEKLREMRSMGQVTGDDLVWREGFTEWKPLSTILGEAQPPPLPKEVGAPPDLSVPDFVIDADGNIHLNKDSLQEYFDEKVQLVGRDRSVQIGKFQLGTVLVCAAATGNWTGGVDLFDTGMADRRRLTLKTLDQKVISERDASLLSLALNKMITTVTETVGPEAADVSPIAEWKLVAGIAGGGKFSIQFIE